MAKRTIDDDARAFLGVPPHDTGSNYVRSDGYFARDCAEYWGEAAFNEALRVARERHARGMAAYQQAVDTINKVC